MDKKEKEIIGAVAKALRAVGEAFVVVANVLLDEVSAESQAPAQAAPSDAKPARRGRKPKSTEPAQEEEEETDIIDTSDLKNEPEAEDDDFADLEEEDEAEEEIDEAKLRAKLVEYAKAKGGPDEARKVLKKFKAAKVADLKPADYAKVYAELDKGL